MPLLDKKGWHEVLLAVQAAEDAQQDAEATEALLMQHVAQVRNAWQNVAGNSRVLVRLAPASDGVAIGTSSGGKQGRRPSRQRDRKSAD